MGRIPRRKTKSLCGPNHFGIPETWSTREMDFVTKKCKDVLPEEEQ